MNSDEALNNKFYSTEQHRGNKGNEGQLHVKHDNIDHLNRFELKDENIENAIREAAKRKSG